MGRARGHKLSANILSLTIECIPKECIGSPRTLPARIACFGPTILTGPSRYPHAEEHKRGYGTRASNSYGIGPRIWLQSYSFWWHLCEIILMSAFWNFCFSKFLISLLSKNRMDLQKRKLPWRPYLWAKIRPRPFNLEPRCPKTCHLGCKMTPDPPQKEPKRALIPQLAAKMTSKCPHLEPKWSLFVVLFPVEEYNPVFKNWVVLYSTKTNEKLQKCGFHFVPTWTHFRATWTILGPSCINLAQLEPNLPPIWSMCRVSVPEYS